MVFYTYKAKNINGEILEGKCLCNDENDLIITLRDKGFYTIKYNEIKNRKNFSIFSKVSSKDLSIFCNQFASLLQAGINISEILDILYNQSLNKNIKISINEISELLKQGAELSYCMKLYKNIYPDFLINMIKVGEESGKLDEIFLNLSYFYNNENKIKNKITKAMFYPTITFFISIVVMEFMANKIIPIFISTLESLQASIPIITRIFINTVLFINHSILYLFPFFTIVFWEIKYNKIFKNIKMFFHKFLLNNRFIKEISGKLIAVKFSNCMAILLGSGVNVIKAFEITCDVIENKYAKENIKICIDKIKCGSNISESLKYIKFFPDFLFSMIKIGEETGLLKETLLKASDIMDMELNNSIDKIITLIEPIVIILLSIIIGFMLIAMFTPMINVMDAI